MEKQWILYILQCKDGSLYTGITDHLAHRLQAHGTAKGAKYTRGRGPFVLRYTESCESHSHALRREIQVKRLTRQEKLKLIETYTGDEIETMRNLLPYTGE